MICTVCQRDNEACDQLCGRCGANLDRSVPPLLVLESLLTREFIWGINIAGVVLPLGLLGGGFLGAWVLWDSLGFSGFSAIAGLAMLAPGTIFALAMIPTVRKLQSALFGLGVFAMLGLIAAAIGGLFLALYLFTETYG
ncbi:MAG: hypothetical protein DSY79_01110 [Chloroflexi bacterium]|jgi:hypothetical protein|nr:MAG: hypothetical protein DSY79_01110 [Chloroflexota bacterium]